jgi:transcriptional regulator with XRE-family HTH domain
MLKLKKNTVLGLMHLAGYSTQLELASALGVTRQWLGEMLNGRGTPSTDQLVQMCQLLGCTIEEIADYPKVPALIAA